MSIPATFHQVLAKTPFKNVDSTPAPPFAVLQVVGSTLEDGVAFLSCQQPGTTLGSEYATNGPSPVAPGEYGVAFRSGDVRIAYDSGTPAAGEIWGVRAGQWTLSQGYPAIAAVHSIHNSANQILRGRLNALRSVLGVAAAPLAAAAGGVPGSATVAVHVGGASGFAAASPAMSFTGYNLSTATIPAGRLTQFVESHGLWLAIAGAGTGERHLKAVLGATLAHGDDTATIGSVTTLGGASADVSPTSAMNVNKWAGTTGETCVILEDASSGSPLYYLLSVEWDEIARVSSVEYDSEELQETYTTKQFLGKESGEESDPFDVWQATLKQVITNVVYSGMAELKFTGYVSVLPGTPETNVMALVWQGVQCYTSPAALSLTFQALQSVELYEDGGHAPSTINAFYF